MEAIYSSETSVDFQCTTRRYIPEESDFNGSSVCKQEPVGFLFIYGLFNDAVSPSNYKASNDGLISESWIDDNLEENDRGLFKNTTRAFLHRDSVKTRICQKGDLQLTQQSGRGKQKHCLMLSARGSPAVSRLCGRRLVYW
jgi:hypothetical protein